MKVFVSQTATGRTVSRHTHTQMTCIKCDSTPGPELRGPRPKAKTSGVERGREAGCRAVPVALPPGACFPAESHPPPPEPSSCPSSAPPLLCPHPCAAGASLRSRLAFLTAAPPLPFRLPLPALVVSCGPGLFAAQGQEEDILPILQALSLIEMGSKTRLQQKSLLWAALLEENESPKQIGFHDLRQTSLFILYNPV